LKIECNRRCAQIDADNATIPARPDTAGAGGRATFQLRQICEQTHQYAYLHKVAYSCNIRVNLAIHPLVFAQCPVCNGMLHSRGCVTLRYNERSLSLERVAVASS
jgi:hypothetical protein